MFYFDTFNGNKVLKSDYLDEITAFFTTRTYNNIPFADKVDIKKPEQTHGDNVEFADERETYPHTDGLITDNTNTALCLKFADCTPLMFYNPITKAGAVSHAGWRGTAAKIGVKTVLKMGGNPEDIIAVIGPAIGLCCYEVSDDVKSKLLMTVKDTDKLSVKNHVDLKAINARQLQEIGVKNIDVCPYCTSCDNDLFFSYRKENGTPERHYAIMRLC